MAKTKGKKTDKFRKLLCRIFYSLSYKFHKTSLQNWLTPKMYGKYLSQDILNPIV